MTTLPPEMTEAAARTLVGRRVELRWSAVVAAARDRLGVCGNGGRGHCRVGFVIMVEPVDDRHVLTEAWL